MRDVLRFPSQTPAKVQSMKQEDRRNRSTKKLIKAYLELAAEQGVASITFDSIGERAGYSRGLAFQKFGSKDGLLEAVINHLHDEVEQAQHDAHSEDVTGIEALLLFCRIHLLSFNKGDELKAYFVLLSSAVAEQSDMRRHFVRSHIRSEETLKAIFKRGVKDGSIRPETNIEQAALLVGTQLVGISVQSLVKPDFDLTASCTELCGQIIRGYGTAAYQGLPVDVPLELQPI